MNPKVLYLLTRIKLQTGSCSGPDMQNAYQYDMLEYIYNSLRLRYVSFADDLSIARGIPPYTKMDNIAP